MECIDIEPLGPFREHLPRSPYFELSYLSHALSMNPLAAPAHILNMNSLACIRSSATRAASRSTSGCWFVLSGALFFTHFAATPLFSLSIRRLSELALLSACRHVASSVLLVFRRVFRISLSWSLTASVVAGFPCLRFICFLRYFTSLNFFP
jgi:hypothetical protein